MISNMACQAKHNMGAWASTLRHPCTYTKRWTQSVFLAIFSVVLSGCFSTTVQETKISKLPKTQPEMIQIDAQDDNDNAALELAQSFVNASDLFVSTRKKASIQVKNQIAKALGDLQKKRYVAAENALKVLFRNEINIPSNVYVLAGDIALALENTEQAVKHYQQALNQNKHNAKAANRLAKHMREQGKFMRAYGLYSQAITSQPSHAESYRNRAVLNDLYLNDKAKALADYQAYDALLKYRLALHEGRVLVSHPVEYPSQAISEQVTDDASQTTQLNAQQDVKEPFATKKIKQRKLSEKALKALKKDLKLVKRWLFDVGRQVEAIAKLEASTQQNKANEKGE